MYSRNVPNDIWAYAAVWGKLGELHNSEEYLNELKDYLEESNGRYTVFELCDIQSLRGELSKIKSVN